MILFFPRFYRFCKYFSHNFQTLFLTKLNNFYTISAQMTTGPSTTTPSLFPNRHPFPPSTFKLDHHSIDILKLINNVHVCFEPCLIVCLEDSRTVIINQRFAHIIQTSCDTLKWSLVPLVKVS